MKAPNVVVVQGGLGCHDGGVELAIMPHGTESAPIDYVLDARRIYATLYASVPSETLAVLRAIFKGEVKP